MKKDGNESFLFYDLFLTVVVLCSLGLGVYSVRLIYVAMEIMPHDDGISDGRSH